MDCLHIKINIIPTIATAWAVADQYYIECEECKEILITDAPLEVVTAFISTHKCRINYGLKYLPQNKQDH